MKWPSGLSGAACRASWVLLLATLGTSVGCQGLSDNPGFGYTHTDDDVVAIRQFYSRWPWLRDADGRINGICARTYLQSGKTGKGIFVPGVISVTMSILERRSDGCLERHRVHEWTFSEGQAMGFRVREPSILGDSYGFVLQWPPEVNVMGRTIELVFYYQRRDGRFINGPARQMRVPLTPGFPAHREPEGAYLRRPGVPETQPASAPQPEEGPN